MPRVNITPNQSIFCWEITESIEELSSVVILSEEENKIFNSFRKDKRKLEILASRAMLQSVIPNSHIKYVNKNPTIEGSDKEISISHSGGKVLIQIKPKDELVGVDIQYISEKTIRIKEKFLHFSELEIINEHEKDELILSNIFWSAKESVYKAFSSISKSEEVIEFKSQIIFESIDFDANIINGVFIEEGEIKKIIVGFLEENDFVVTWFEN